MALKKQTREYKLHTEEEFKAHPQLMIIQALRQASDDEARLLLRLLAEVARGGIRKTPPVIVDGRKIPGGLPAVFLKGEHIRIPELECSSTTRVKRIVTAIEGNSRGTWVVFSEFGRLGITELFGDSVNIIGDTGKNPIIPRCVAKVSAGDYKKGRKPSVFFEGEDLKQKASEIYFESKDGATKATVFDSSVVTKEGTSLTFSSVGFKVIGMLVGISEVFDGKRTA